MSYQATLTYGDYRIPYRVNADPRKSSKIAIHVDPDGSVTVDAPPEYDASQVSKAVLRRARWVVSNVEDANNRFRHLRPKRYVSGEEVLYLGRRYMLRVEPDADAKPKAKLRGNKLIVTPRQSDSEAVQPIVRAWYRSKARDYYARLIDEKSQELPWITTPPPFRLQDMTRQWGSCSPGGSILLNPHLIKAPRPCIEYVVLHELAHLKHHDHSPEFFRLIDRNLPGWRSHKSLLDNMVEHLVAQ
ncbi:M48 family metallopeptidase [Tropicibacter sp. Alg240-R139]|uniref:M48 family metallopeptidase n=1 Tax=Tropicibacter sp. Alg240-R139 TaxID=2305991 RepID=UPI0013E04737|nr:SprT family zinc-dependent metalloprotease [Tropicibacter sp. Alg240-R139]